MLKPLEVHLRCTVVEGYFGPLRALLTDDEASHRAHLVALEEEKRLLLEALEGSFAARGDAYVSCADGGGCAD